jgi:hypothetical protein
MRREGEMRALRFLLRLIGTCLVAAGFVALVIDGTRSIADGNLALTTFGDTLFGLDPSVPGTLQGWIQGGAPWLWDPVTVWILAQPAFAVLAVIGAILVLLGRPSRRHRLDAPEYA